MRAMNFLRRLWHSSTAPCSPLREHSGSSRVIGSWWCLARLWPELAGMPDSVAAPADPLRLGLHTGMVIWQEQADTPGAMPVLGDTLALAVQVAQQAEPGALLLSAATARLALTVVRLETLGSRDAAR